MIKLYCQYCGVYCGQRPEIVFKMAKGADVEIVATCNDCLYPKKERSNPFEGKDIMDFLMGFKK